MIFHQKFAVTGIANKTILDAGIQSTEKVKKTLISVLIQTSAYNGNTVEGWIQQLKVTEVAESLLDTVERESDEKMNKSANRINEIPVAAPLEIGQLYQIGINSGATPSDISGSYVYEISGS
jgi:hypothetical protein